MASSISGKANILRQNMHFPSGDVHSSMQDFMDDNQRLEMIK
jgi:hypothetical protein